MFEVRDIIESMDGITLLLGPDLKVIDYGRCNWDEFWSKNSLEDSPVYVGKSILDAISDEDARLVLEKLFREVLTVKRPKLEVSYRCDAPTLERHMRLSVRPLKAANGSDGLIYQSILLYTQERIPLSIFDAEFDASGKAFVTLCYGCAKVSWSSSDLEAQREWIGPEEYYRRGGPDVDLVSHGLCPKCLENWTAENSGAELKQGGA